MIMEELQNKIKLLICGDCRELGDKMYGFLDHSSDHLITPCAMTLHILVLTLVTLA